MHGRQIHEAIGMAQEGLHSIKTQRMRDMVMKVVLSEAYNRTNWLYLRLIIIYIGFCVQMVKWIIGCLSFVSFAVLINGSASEIFRPTRGLRQGCPMSPLLFLIIVEGLRRLILEAKIT